MKELLVMTFMVPIIGSFCLPLVSRFSAKLRNALSLVFVMTAFICSSALLPEVVAGRATMLRLELPLGLSFGFLADGLAVFMACVSSFVGAIIVIYSFTYIDEPDHQGEYYLMVTLFIGAMMGLVYSTNMVFLYLFWEISAICCWRLIGFRRHPDYILRADKAFLITVFGALVMFLGLLLVYQQTSTFELTAMSGVQLSSLSVLCIMVGLMSKSATLPLHSWLPDAGVAPASVTSLLHAAVLVKIGVYAYARLFLVTFDIAAVWHQVVPIVAAVSALVTAGVAIRENDLKRIIAYSTVSQIAFIFLGLSTGSLLGAAGGLLYILMHSLAKGGLFLCAGIVEHATHTKDLNQLGGLYKTMPVTAACFLVCSLSVMGVPPFGGFFSKYMVIAGAVQAEQPWVAAVFVVGAVLTVVYLLRAFNAVFLGEERTPAHEGSRSMLACVASLSGLSLIGGLLIAFPASFVLDVVSRMGGLY